MAASVPASRVKSDMSKGPTALALHSGHGAGSGNDAWTLAHFRHMSRLQEQGLRIGARFSKSYSKPSHGHCNASGIQITQLSSVMASEKKKLGKENENRVPKIFFFLLSR
jgi:hypothetical protein